MTQQQILIVQKTWRSFRMIKPEVVADVFYSKLFSEIPSMQKIFSGVKEDEHTTMVDMFSTVIGRLHNLEEVMDILELVWKRQRILGVREAHSVHIKKALMWTLQHGLGSDWTEEVQYAWDSCYDMIAHRIFELSEFK